MKEVLCNMFLPYYFTHRRFVNRKSIKCRCEPKGVTNFVQKVVGTESLSVAGGITGTLPRLTYGLFYTMAKGNALIIYCSKYFYLNTSYMV